MWTRARAGWLVQDKEYTDEGYDSDSTRVVDSAKLAEPELLTWIFNSDLAQVQRMCASSQQPPLGPKACRCRRL